MTAEQNQENEARQWAINIAAEWHLQDEVRDYFDREVKKGVPPWRAAREALYEWDL